MVILISPATWGHKFLVAPETWLYFKTSVKYVYFMSRFGLSLGYVLHFRGFAITLRHTTIGRTPLDHWLAWRSDLYLTKHNTHKRQTSMPPAGFKPTILASERPKTHALDRTGTGFGTCQFYFNCKFWPSSICTLSSELGPQFYISLCPENFQAGPVICLKFFPVSDAWIDCFIGFIFLSRNIFAYNFEILH
jgi:hypothetical protein